MNKSGLSVCVALISDIQNGCQNESCVLIWNGEKCKKNWWASGPLVLLFRLILFLCDYKDDNQIMGIHESSWIQDIWWSSSWNTIPVSAGIQLLSMSKRNTKYDGMNVDVIEQTIPYPVYWTKYSCLQGADNSWRLGHLFLSRLIYFKVIICRIDTVMSLLYNTYMPRYGDVVGIYVFKTFLIQGHSKLFCWFF
jgi:hypothetical protein